MNALASFRNIKHPSIWKETREGLEMCRTRKVTGHQSCDFQTRRFLGDGGQGRSIRAGQQMVKSQVPPCGRLETRCDSMSSRVKSEAGDVSDVSEERG